MILKDERMKVVWDTLKGNWISISSILVLYICIILFRPRAELFIGGVPIVFALLDAWRTWRGDLERDPWRVLKSAGFTLCFLYALFILSSYLGGWGLLGFLILGVGLGLYAIIRQWGRFMWWVRHIEKEYLYGETLEERKERNGETR